jgi:hypothetical protein
MLITDHYRTARGSWSRVLTLSCKNCGTFLFHYQKDGSGPLKRSYLDRIIGNNSLVMHGEWAHCPRCSARVGFTEPYAKENNRLAIRWAAEAVISTIIAADTLKQ